MQEPLTISRVAALTGTAVDTLRFYERKKLIQAPPRNHSGYRIYTPEIVERIRFIKSARDHGFSLNEIEELIAIDRHGPPELCGIGDRIRERIIRIDNEIERLSETRQRLVTLRGACVESRRCDACHLIKAISAAAPDFTR